MGQGFVWSWGHLMHGRQQPPVASGSFVRPFGRSAKGEDLLSSRRRGRFNCVSSISYPAPVHLLIERTATRERESETGIINSNPNCPRRRKVFRSTVKQIDRFYRTPLTRNPGAKRDTHTHCCWLYAGVGRSLLVRQLANGRGKMANKTPFCLPLSTRPPLLGHRRRKEIK